MWNRFSVWTRGAAFSVVLALLTAPAMSQFVEHMGEQDEAAIEALAKAIEEKRRRADADV